MGWFCQIWRSFWGSLGRVAQNGKSYGRRVEVIIPKDIQLARRIKSERTWFYWLYLIQLKLQSDLHSPCLIKCVREFVGKCYKGYFGLWLHFCIFHTVVFFFGTIYIIYMFWILQKMLLIYRKRFLVHFQFQDSYQKKKSHFPQNVFPKQTETIWFSGCFFYYYYMFDLILLIWF